MAVTWILRLPQVDKPNQPLLVHVTQKPGTKLDLDILATDGNNAYRGKVRQRNLAKLRSKNFEGTDEEWTSLLQYALFSKQVSDASTNQTENLEVDCVISGKGLKAILSITLRSRIEDITHKLGAVDLSYSEDTDDVDLFGWASQLAHERDKLEVQNVSSVKAANTTEETIAKLKAQLEDLVKAKEEHETQLLSKFAALLNEKKLKIRNQQRILQTAKVDQKKLDEMQLTFHGDQNGVSSTKRKRGDESSKGDAIAEEDDSDGFEPMDIDQDLADNIEATGNSGEVTPSRSKSAETETASEDEGNASPTESTNASKPSIEKARKFSPPPPPRSLPFQKKKATRTQATKKAEPRHSADVDGDEETESEDDEL